MNERTGLLSHFQMVEVPAANDGAFHSPWLLRNANVAWIYCWKCQQITIMKKSWNGKWKLPYSRQDQLLVQFKNSNLELHFVGDDHLLWYVVLPVLPMLQKSTSFVLKHKQISQYVDMWVKVNIEILLIRIWIK